MVIEIPYSNRKINNYRNNPFILLLLIIESYNIWFYNKQKNRMYMLYLLLNKFKVCAVSYGSSFFEFSHSFMAEVWSMQAVNQREKTKIRNLQ